MFLDFLFNKPNIETLLKKSEKQFAVKDYSTVIRNIDQFLERENLDLKTDTMALGKLLMFKLDVQVFRQKKGFQNSKSDKQGIKKQGTTEISLYP